MYNVNGLTFFDPEVPMYLELTLPSGEVWAKDDPASPNYIKGSARDWRSWRFAVAIGWTPILRLWATKLARMPLSFRHTLAPQIPLPRQRISANHSLRSKARSRDLLRRGPRSDRGLAAAIS